MKFNHLFQDVAEGNYYNGVTSEAQLKLLCHSGEGFGHQSNTGDIMYLIFSELKSIQHYYISNIQCLALTGFNSFNEVDNPSLHVKQTHKISPRVGLMLPLNCLNSVQKYVYS